MTHRGPGGRALTEEEKILYYPPKAIIVPTGGGTHGGHDSKPKVTPLPLLLVCTRCHIRILSCSYRYDQRNSSYLKKSIYPLPTRLYRFI